MSNLKNLRINQEGILPSFDKEIHDYYLTIAIVSYKSCIFLVKAIVKP